jgi:hypothetical protein
LLPTQPQNQEGPFAGTPPRSGRVFIWCLWPFRSRSQRVMEHPGRVRLLVVAALPTWGVLCGKRAGYLPSVFVYRTFGRGCIRPPFGAFPATHQEARSSRVRWQTRRGNAMPDPFCGYRRHADLRRRADRSPDNVQLERRTSAHLTSVNRRSPRNAEPGAAASGRGANAHGARRRVGIRDHVLQRRRPLELLADHS